MRRKSYFSSGEKTELRANFEQKKGRAAVILYMEDDGKWQKDENSKTMKIE